MIYLQFIIKEEKMTRLIWDANGARFYETGVNQGVLYPRNAEGLYPLGVVWNGLTSVSESPSGAKPSPIYADDIKYLNLMSVEEFGASIEAYTYPDEFAACDGSAEIATGVTIGQQNRSMFGLCYKTTLGNDVDGPDYGYKLHLVYGALAAPSEKGYSTINDSPEAITFSWEITTTPVAVTGKKPTASLTIDSTKVSSTTLATLEDILYGTSGADPHLPLPDDIAALFAAGAPSALELSSVGPLDDAEDQAITVSVVLTFNNAIARESVVVASAAGEIIAGAKTWDVAGKILTFTPTDNLANNTVYVVTVGGVVDIYGQSLAAVVKNFTTVA
jgi:hypothetical protein